MIIRRSKLLFTLGLVLSLWSMLLINFSFSATTIAEKVILRAGTPVILSLEKSISTDIANVGDPVDLVVIREVKVDGKTVIETGSSVRGEVSAVEKKGVIGKPGKISIAVKSVVGVDGKNVPLRATLTREGKGKETTALIVGLVLCILGLFLIKGEHGVITAGSEIKAYVDYDVEFEFN